MDNNEIDYKRAAEQLRNGEPLFGKDGALAPMLERILNAALEGEMDAHLSIDERSQGNRRNGKLPKQVQNLWYCPKKCVTIISHIFHFVQNYLLSFQHLH